MRFVVVGCNFRTAPLDLRERLAFAPEEHAVALKQLAAHPEVAETLLLSTCNRVEVYAVSVDPLAAQSQVSEFLARSRRIEMGLVNPTLYRYQDEEALRHIFRVAASLDAMVVGEAQILGQVKQALAQANDADTTGPLLGRCMDKALSVAKRVRSETEVARHPASVSSVAVDLAGRIFSDLATVGVLIIGSGEMAELAGRRLLSQGASRVHVANRNLDRGRALAGDLGGHAVPFDELEHQLCWADVIISSTASKQPILGKKLLADVMRRRKQRPLLIVDIAVPRDVDRDARSLDNLYLFDVDDLEQVVEANLNVRSREAKLAEQLVTEEVAQFSSWLRSQDAVPVIKELRTRFSQVARREALRTARLRLDDAEQRAALEKLADAIVKKLLHTPTVELKKYAASPNGTYLADAARKLFNLPEPEVGPDEDADSTVTGDEHSIPPAS